jgi:hypothetical protein
MKTKNYIFDYLTDSLGFGGKEDKFKEYQLRKIAKAAKDLDEAFYACELHISHGYSIHKLETMLMNGDKEDYVSVSEEYKKLTENDRYDDFEKKLQE